MKLQDHDKRLLKDISQLQTHLEETAFSLPEIKVKC